MSKQNKDNLENFFRERAQHPGIEFNEGDWLKLEKQLDNEMPIAITFASFLKKYWFIPLLILLIPITWLSHNTFTKTTINSISTNLTNQESTYDRFNQSDILSAEKGDAEGGQRQASKKNNEKSTDSNTYQNSQQVLRTKPANASISQINNENKYKLGL